MSKSVVIEAPPPQFWDLGVGWTIVYSWSGPVELLCQILCLCSKVLCANRIFVNNLGFGFLFSLGGCRSW